MISIGGLFSDRLSKSETVLRAVGHIDIGEQQPNIIAPLQNPDGFVCVARFDCLEAGILDHCRSASLNRGYRRQPELHFWAS